MRHPLIASLLFVLALFTFALAPVRAEEFNDSEKQEIEQIITDYLLENPDLIRKVFVLLREQDQERERHAQAERAEIAKKALVDNKEAIFKGEHQIVLGNPDGDVTLVEFLDYNCGYCKRAFGNMLQLIDNDDNLRVILKEWPVLGEASMEAALVAIGVTKLAPEKYWDFHKAMMTMRGGASKESAMRTAEKVGVDRAELEKLYEDETLIDPIKESYRLADLLGLTGTPGFVLGDEVIPGFVPTDVLKQKIAHVRSCGSTSC